MTRLRRARSRRNQLRRRKTAPSIVGPRVIASYADLQTVAARVACGKSFRFQTARSADPEAAGVIRVQFEGDDAWIPEGRVLATSSWSEVPRGAATDFVVRGYLQLATSLLTHEIHETFRYRGVRVFDPHTPIATLLLRRSSR